MNHFKWNSKYDLNQNIENDMEKTRMNEHVGEITPNFKTFLWMKNLLK